MKTNFESPNPNLEFVLTFIAGSIHLKAASPALQAAELTIESKACTLRPSVP
jgi:hypothetical protein